MAQQVEAILLGAGERLLMAVNHVGGILFDFAESDETFTDQALAGVGHGEFLEVRKNAGLGIAGQHAGGDPVFQMLRGTGVRIVRLGIRRSAFAQDDAHQVVRAEREIALLHRRRDLVVRLGDEMVQRSGLCRVSKRLKRVDLSHFSGYQ